MNIEQLRGNWNYPTPIRFGRGRIVELAEVCKSAGISRPLLVTDPGLAGLNMVANILSRNESAGLPTGVFSGVQANPVSANVDAGLEVYRNGGHDGVIALGGGSPLDVAKAIALMLPQCRPIWEFEDIGDNFKRAMVEGIAPVVAVPTTAGTGSEVGRCSVITDEATHTKKIIFHPKMLPITAILDPELTVGMSPKMTAGTGFDALAHNLEAYCAPTCHPMGEGIAVEGTRLCHQYLGRAYRDGSDLVARAQMLAAATMGATAFQKGLGAVHALSHPIGAIYGTHHGLTNAVFLPYVLQFNRPAIEPKITRLAAYMGFADTRFEAFLEWILELRQQLDIPHTLTDLGIGDERFEEMSEMAAVDPPAETNPVPVGKADLLGLYQMALSGSL